MGRHTPMSIDAFTNPNKARMVQNTSSEIGTAPLMQSVIRRKKNMKVVWLIQLRPAAIHASRVPDLCSPDIFTSLTGSVSPLAFLRAYPGPR